MSAKLNSDPNPVRAAVALLRGAEAVGRLCGVTGKAVQKWIAAGRLPRTEATGETQYAEIMARADPRIKKHTVLATVFRNGARPRVR